MRSVVYRFPDLAQFEQMLHGASPETELALGLPSGEEVRDGEWVLAIFELGRARRATAVASRAAVSQEGSRLLFDPRDWRHLAQFAKTDARHPSSRAPARDRQGARITEEPSATPATTKSVTGAPPAGRASRPPGQAARVLIVDSDVDTREMVGGMLEAVGLCVLPVGTAEEALAHLRTGSCDLVVIEWILPRMSGLELCRRIRETQELHHLPVLFLTARAASQDVVDAFASGADDYVVKPFRSPELGARIFSLLRRGRLMQGG